MRVEHRRSTRITGGFWLAVEGQDGSPVHRQGDLSLSGAYFPVERHPGKVGSPIYVHVASTDWSCSVQVLAKIVRIALIDDLVRGLVPIGAAVEFMAESEATRDALSKLVARVTELERESTPHHPGREALNTQLQGQNSADNPVSTEEAGVDRITLETTWIPEQGERLEVEILRPAATRRISLEALVVSVDEDENDANRQYVGLAIKHGTVRATGTGSLAADSACQSMLADLVEGDSAMPTENLMGSLCRSMCVPSVLSFLAMESLSGELLVKSADGQRAQVFLRDGDVIDAETLAGLDPRQILLELVSWHEGSFEFQTREITREDRVGCSTTALLLELTAEADELAR